MTVEDVQTGMILNWQSITWPDKTSRWIVLREIEKPHVEGRRFEMFCIKSNLNSSPDLNQSTTYIFHQGNIHHFSVHSQI